YDLTQATRNYLTMEQILHQLAFETTRLVKVEGTFLLLQGTAGHLTIEHYPEPKMENSTLRGFLERVQTVGHAVLLNGDQLGDRHPDLHNLLLMPVRVSGELVATLGLLNKIGGDFTSPNIKLARAIAEHAGARIENAILYQQQLDSARMQTEMELAQNVQLNLLPEAAPHVEGLDLWAGSRPASQVGGDFFDFINRPDNPFMVAVGDVSGKGMPAAMLMTMMRTVIRSKSSSTSSEVTPERIIDRSNDELYQDFTELSMFATVFVAQYLPEGKQLRYANAGHSPVIFCPQGGEARLLEADGTAIGILPTSFSENHLLDICPGDVMVIATDGINEARNENDELFGYDQLLRLVEKLAHLPAKEIAEEIFRTAREFGAGQAQDDDQTLVVLKGAQG
ncbi:MAG: SpoIIE family protein phosphatase, partial [Anaerolineales bacterium]|nr:SpoIIE family protein phosphatase [Anaerolineales bacterium]